MPTLSLTKTKVPFLLGGQGEVIVDTSTVALNKALAEGADSVFSVRFKAGAEPKVSLGQTDSVKLGVSTSASVDLRPIFSTSTGAQAKPLATYGIGDFFKNANADRVVLCLEVGAAGAVDAAGSFSIAPLKASLELDAAADAGFAYLRSFDKSRSTDLIVPEFFKTICLPDQLDRAPERGEAIALRFAGSLRLAAEVSAGYKLAGTKGFSIGQIALSEKYDLSIIGKIGLSAAVAGRFSILITAADDLPGWARAQVRRHRAKEVTVAADVSVGLKNELNDLPATANEFLGAALGVNAKNFLNVFKRAVELSDIKTFEQAVDGLAKHYIEEVVGHGFDELTKSARFNAFMALVNKVTTSYESVGDRAVTLFDRYFDRIDQLTTFLDRIQGLADDGLAALKKDLNPQLWNIFAQLTDGDPLAFLLKQVIIAGKPVNSLAELKTRAASALDLIRKPAHAEIRRVIAVAKQQFGLDVLFDELAKVDSPSELQALANEKTGLFVTRLVGRTLDSATNVKQAFAEAQAVLTKIDAFPTKLFDAFKAATNSSYTFALHAAYSRASESDSLIDVNINMNSARGAALLSKAGKGDFEEIIATADTGLVRLREGVFTHRTRRESAFKVNIVGWHLNYKYEGFDRVITETEQRLLPTDQGITILTTATLGLERQRKRQNEEIHVNFLLRALGHSRGVVKSDDENLSQYLIDSLNSWTARYQLDFTDEDTTAMELQDYLAFARDLGLDRQGATAAQLKPMLPLAANGGYGAIKASYDVRFGQAALDALAGVKQLSQAAEFGIRNALRMMVLSNYLKSDEQHDVAFAYASPAVFVVFDTEGFAKFTNHSQRQFAVKLANAAIAAPVQVVLNSVELEVLKTLYNIEDSLVSAIKDLIKLPNGGKIDPLKFEKSLGKFGGALKDFDSFDQTTSKRGIGTTTVFAVFDMLVRLAAGGTSANISVLRLTSKVAGKDVEKVFLSDQAAKGD